eukprot:6179641-Pleurochrysis_carterae.AAC.1
MSPWTCAGRSSPRRAQSVVSVRSRARERFRALLSRAPRGICPARVRDEALQVVDYLVVPPIGGSAN